MFRRFNRWHSRFDQPDPYGGSYNPGNPQSFNRYSYTQNDPVNFVDPTGLVESWNCQWTEHGWACGGVGSVTIHVSWADEIDAGTGGPNEFGSPIIRRGDPLGPGGAGPQPQNSDKAIASAVDRARTILSTKNPCSDYFGTNAIKALNTFEKILTRGYPNGPGDTQLGIKQSGPQTTYNTPTEYRTFQNAVINNAGPFFSLLSKTRFGGYNPGSNQSQVLQILHELAHLVYSGSAPLIPDDSGPTKKVDSDTNTREILKHCRDQIDKIKN